VTNGYDRGGASNYICMPNDPQYTLAFRPGVQGYSYVYGTEYEQPPPGYSVHQHNAVCAVCYVADKHTTIMIPAHTSCPSGWILDGWRSTMATLSLNIGPWITAPCISVSMFNWNMCRAVKQTLSEVTFILLKLTAMGLPVRLMILKRNWVVLCVASETQRWSFIYIFIYCIYIDRLYIYMCVLILLL